MNRIYRCALIALCCCFSLRDSAHAEESPSSLGTIGLKDRDFFYAGEAKQRRMFIVKRGEVVWSYDDPAGKGEISDAVLMSSGRVVVAHQFAVKVIDRDKKILWNLDAPEGAEIHTAQPIGKDHIVYVQNSNPALVKVVNITSGQTVRQFEVPVKNPDKVHGHFRHARLTPSGTLLVAHMDLGKVAEYDEAGKELWSMSVPGVWGVTPLASGNVLLCGKSGIREVNRDKQAVWEVKASELGEFKPLILQTAIRRANGNTVLTNWINEWTAPIDPATAPVQVVEFSPDKQVVWKLRSWDGPNLGPATIIQFLDDPLAAEDVHFGEIR
jgi:hypothetical protein